MDKSFPESILNSGTRRSKSSIYLVAENRLLREALTKLLRKKGDFSICGASSYFSEIVGSIANSGADILILDSMILQLSTFALLPEILRRGIDIKVVLIDMECNPELFLDCVRAGVAGYLLKDASAADIISGLRAVSLGNAVCPSELCMTLFRTVSHHWISRPTARVKIEFGLTRRQQQLVPLIADGLTNKEIASHLNVSEQTVKNHIHRMLRRVGVTGRLEVVDLLRQQNSAQVR